MGLADPSVARLWLACSLVMMMGAGCGHTRIVATEAHARIYVNGQLVGRGEAEMARTGFPQRSEIEARGASGRAHRSVRRQFTLTTFVAGMFTYFTGWLWAWQYPEEITLVLPVPATKAGGWDESASAWDQAPTGWQAPPPQGN